jgi:hypothetical protein
MHACTTPSSWRRRRARWPDGERARPGRSARPFGPDGRPGQSTQPVGPASRLRRVGPPGPAAVARPGPIRAEWTARCSEEARPAVPWDRHWGRRPGLPRARSVWWSCFPGTPSSGWYVSIRTGPGHGGRDGLMRTVRRPGALSAAHFHDTLPRHISTTHRKPVEPVWVAGLASSHTGKEVVLS